MTNHARSDWRVVVLAIVGGGTGLLAVAVGLSAAAYAFVGPWIRLPDSVSLDRLDVFVIIGVLELIGAVLLTSSYYALQVLRGRPDRHMAAHPLKTGQVLILVLLWLASSVLAQILVGQGSWRWTAPFLHLLAIGAPIYLLVRLATGGLRGGSRLRLWGTLATGLIVGTGLAAIAEIALLLLAIAAGASYLTANPEQMLALERLAVQLGGTSGIEEALTLLGPVLVRPFVLLVVLAAVSGATPVIEELAKSTASWVLFDHLSSAGHGFWSGAIAGAGFALFEGLVASADATDRWAFVLLMRAGSSMMHILASALAGWGIAAFRNGNRAIHLLGGYAFAIGMHAFWNASVVAIGYGGIRSVFSGSGSDMLGLMAIAAGALVLSALIALLPVALILINGRLRSAQLGSSAALAMSAAEPVPVPGLES